MRAYKIRYSVQFKFAAAFIVILAGLILIMNSYPIIQFRNLVFSSKKTSMQNQAQVMSASLSTIEPFSSDNVKQVMGIIDVMPLSRILITDSAGLILYDTADTSVDTGRYALLPEIYGALSDNLVWYSTLSDSAFRSRLAVPVKSRGEMVGAVYLYEYDADQAQLMTSLMVNLRSLSIGISAIAVIVILVFTRALTKRITELSKAMRVVRDGGYDYRLKISGTDELAELGVEFNQLTAHLQQTEEVRRRFVSDASHELKTPLASIRLLSDSILQNDNMETDTVREFVSDIGNESERLARITEKLLSLTRLDREVTIERTAVDVSKVAKDTLHLLTPLAVSHEVTLDYRLSGDCLIYATEDDIYQIIFNLVENAIKYNHPQGEVNLILYKGSSEVYLFVDDTGIGIPPEEASHVFSRFYRIDKARSREAGGSGLGLSIVRDAVILHGGSVEVMPREPEGTRVRVCFPLYESPEESGGASPEPPLDESPELSDAEPAGEPDSREDCGI